MKIARRCAAAVQAPEATHALPNQARPARCQQARAAPTNLQQGGLPASKCPELGTGRGCTRGPAQGWFWAYLCPPEPRARDKAPVHVPCGTGASGAAPQTTHMGPACQTISVRLNTSSILHLAAAAPRPAANTRYGFKRGQQNGPQAGPGGGAKPAACGPLVYILQRPWSSFPNPPAVNTRGADVPDACMQS